MVAPSDHDRPTPLQAALHQRLIAATIRAQSEASAAKLELERAHHELARARAEYRTAWQAARRARLRDRFLASAGIPLPTGVGPQAK